MTRYAKKPDTNHGEIRDALRAIPGMRVLDTADMAGLGCDLMYRFQVGPPRLNRQSFPQFRRRTDREHLRGRERPFHESPITEHAHLNAGERLKVLDGGAEHRGAFA